MRKKVCMALLGFCLVGCGSHGRLDDQGATTSAVFSRSSSVSSLTTEQVPSELSVAYFSTMPLVGTGFTLERVEYRTDMYVRYAIGFRSNGLYISGILNIPAGEGPFPLVVLNHGYIDPKVYTRGRGLKREQDYLARHGFAVLHIDYRGHAESDLSPDTRKVYDAGLEYSMDVVNGIRALQGANLPSVNTDHIGMLGHSMGGGVTQNILVAYPQLVDAAVLYASVHGDAWENFNRWRRERDDDDRTETLGTPEENPNAWSVLSASSLYDRIRTPILVFHGEKDTDVPESWSDTLIERLKNLHKDVAYVEYSSEKHEFIAQWEDFMRRSVVFFEENLGTEYVWQYPLSSDRVTLKRFGTYVTPENSPVQPERFRGYHTGADFELKAGEHPHEVSVQAACTGPLIAKKVVIGYGGVLLQQCLLDGETITVLYGHVQLSSVRPVIGDMLTSGQDIAVLGEGGSDETDGERAHLHFSIHKGDNTEFRGYVQKESDLRDWLDPLVVIGG